MYDEDLKYLKNELHKPGDLVKWIEESNDFLVKKIRWDRCCNDD